MDVNVVVIIYNQQLFVGGVISPIDEDHLMEVLNEMEVGKYFTSTGGSERIVKFIIPPKKSNAFLSAMEKGPLKEKNIAQKLSVSL
ncbi:MAG: hypothetical protein ACD_9C00259G0001 [uncultured bacterium]|nr:MAG: hypothetical protein ACD_9C00259G0001 [uncultured bacterium]